MKPNQKTKNQLSQRSEAPRNKVVRAAIYARYSSEMQSADSIEDQVSIIREYLKTRRIQSRRWPNCEIKILPNWILSDKAQSGRSNFRNNYLKIREGIRTDAFDILLVDNLSRATRDLGGTMDLYNEIKFYGKELVSASEGLSTEDPMAKTFFAVKGMVNDLENDTRANCTKRGMIGKYLRGFSCGTVPYGYRTRSTSISEGKGQNKPRDYEVVIDPEKASVIQRIFRLYADGLGAASIAKKLNEERIPWPSYPKGNGWAQNSITKMFGQCRYVGRWVWATGSWITNPVTGKKIWRKRNKNEWVYFRGKEFNKDLVIIEPALWDRVQKIKRRIEMARQGTRSRQKRVFGRRPENPSKHLLTGILACRRCGANMIVVTARHGGYYGCFNAHRKATCSNRSLIRTDLVEKIVVKQVAAKLTAEEFIAEIARHYNARKKSATASYETRRTALEGESKCLNIEIKNLVEFIASGKISDAVAGTLEKKEDRLEEIGLLLKQNYRVLKSGVFVTPGAIRNKLKKLAEVFDVDRRTAKRVLKALLLSPVQLESKADISRLDIQLNVDYLAQDHASEHEL